MRRIQSIQSLVLAISVAIILAGCAAKGDYAGREYAPNMYHSVAYEPLSQITDESAGTITNALDNGRGEFFNSNKYNPNRMTMREPAPNTVKRDKYGMLPYRIKAVPKDSIPIVTAGLVSPLDSTASLADGKLLFDIYCKHCHGPKGAGDGRVATGETADGQTKGMVPGVANLTGDALKGITEAHIFHVITRGAGLMQPHGSQKQRT
jgi:hypothetical protein